MQYGSIHFLKFSVGVLGTYLSPEMCHRPVIQRFLLHPMRGWELHYSIYSSFPEDTTRLTGMSADTMYREFSVKTMNTGSSLTRKILVMLDVYSVSLLMSYFV